MNVPSIQVGALVRFNGMSAEPASDTMTAESVAVQVIQQNGSLASKYAAGDLSALGALREKALAIARGRIEARELEDTLVRKLGASI